MPKSISLDIRLAEAGLLLAGLDKLSAEEKQAANFRRLQTRLIYIKEHWENIEKLRMVEIRRKADEYKRRQQGNKPQN